MGKLTIKRKWPKIVLIILFVSALLGSVIFSGFRLYNDIRFEVYTERAYHLAETANVITEKVETILDGNWSTLESIESLLSQSKIEDTADVKNTLKTVTEQTFNSTYKIAFIDDQRQTYRSDYEETHIWTETDLLLSDEAKHISLYDDTQGGTSSNEYIIFMSKLTNSIPYISETRNDTYHLTHIALFFDTDNFASNFVSKSYSSQNQTLLLRKDGTRVYYDSNAENFTEYNILNLFKNNVSFQFDGSYEKMLQTIQSENAVGASEIKYDNKDYFVAYTTIQSRWIYITIVPEQYVSVNSTGLVSTMTKAFLLFGGILIAVFLLIIVMLFYIINRNSQLKIKQEANLELQKANEAIQESEKIAIDANNAKSEFLSNMSHDIRTPINGIIGTLDVAELHPDDINHLQKCLGNIKIASLHLKTLINDILDMSRAESGRVTLTEESIDIIELLEACRAMKQGQINQFCLSYTTDYSKIMYPYLIGSPLHIRQVILNILDNAIKYTLQGGSVSLSASETEAGSNNDTTLKVIIADTGIGMSEEFQKKIFEPFTRADNSNGSEMRGTGLGMAIVKRLVDLMGGGISLHSELDKGSTFTITIPMKIDSTRNNNNNNNNIDVTDTDIQGMRVLLAEDNDLNRDIAKTLLEESGVIVTEAVNGKEALDKFLGNKEGTYDAILMDVMMPEMDGIEATKAIRSSIHPEARTIPIFAMTANAFAEDIAKTKAAGMNEHLSKPIDYNLIKLTLAKYKNSQNHK